MTSEVEAVRAPRNAFPAVRLLAEGALVGALIATLWFVEGPGRAAAAAPAPPPVAAPGPPYPITYPGGAPLPPFPMPISHPAAASPAQLPPLPAAPLDAAAAPVRKARPCSFSADDDGIAKAVRDALRARELSLRMCARSLAGGATARFAFRVPAGGAQVTALSPRSSTGLEGCLRPVLAVALDESDPRERAGTVAIALRGPAGADLCNVAVSAAPR